MSERTGEVARLRRQRLALAAADGVAGLDPGQRRVTAALLCFEGGRWQVLVAAPERSGPAIVALVSMVGVFVIGVGPGLGGPSQPGPAAEPGVPDPAEAELLTRTARIAAVLRERGVSPAAVQPVLVVGAPAGPAGRAVYLTERQLVPALRARASRRMRESERALAEHLARRMPALRWLRLDTLAPPEVHGGGERAALFDAGEAHAARLAAARARPIEEWLTFLDHRQLALVTREYSGPARISGPAGTGKTVVALHRLAHLTRRRTGRLLYVSYVRNLPVVEAAAFARLCPDAAHRVEFTNVHAWARSLLAARGTPRRVDTRLVRNAFHLAWAHVGADSRLAELEPDREYWREEVDHVIKGRGLTTLEQYLDVPRARRRVVLRGSARVAAWRLCEEYQRRLRERGAVDHNDVLGAALAQLRAAPASPGYDAVVVDEVQDVPLLALRLLHALVGDRPDGLLLVGDGQQAIYPGGYRLAEAGIPLRGRAEVLTVNYRNAAAVVREARRYDAPNDFDEPAWLDEFAADDVPARPGRAGLTSAPWWLGQWRPAGASDGAAGIDLRDVRIACPGGRRVHCRARSESEHDAALVAAIADSGAAPGETAVITETHAQARHYRRVLRAAGIATMDLADYAGLPTPEVKVGTVHRAKGLEFAAVLLPYLPVALGAEPAGVGLPPCDADALAPRGWRDNALRHRLVAITRARDFVWLGHLAATG